MRVRVLIWDDENVEHVASHQVDRDVAAGQATLRRSRELYCRQGHVIRLAPEAERTVRAVETVLQREGELERLAA